MDISLSRSRNSRRVLLRIPGIIMIAMMLLSLSSCKAQVPSAPRILKEGDNLNGMVVATGISDAPPLEVFCNLEVDEETTTIDCQVPLLPKLAIGRLIGAAGRDLQELDWAELDWEVYLDGYLLDLDTFGVQSYTEPEIPSTPFAVREVFKQKKTWDIVLIHPTFGLHTLICTARSKSVVYSWVVNFMINSTRGPQDMIIDRLPNNFFSVAEQQKE